MTTTLHSVTRVAGLLLAAILATAAPCAGMQLAVAAVAGDGAADPEPEVDEFAAVRSRIDDDGLGGTDYNGLGRASGHTVSGSAESKHMTGFYPSQCSGTASLGDLHIFTGPPGLSFEVYPKGNFSASGANISTSNPPGYRIDVSMSLGNWSSSGSMVEDGSFTGVELYGTLFDDLTPAPDGSVEGSLTAAPIVTLDADGEAMLGYSLLIAVTSTTGVPGQHSRANGSAYLGLQAGDVVLAYDLPDGVTVNSASGNIVDNVLIPDETFYLDASPESVAAGQPLQLLAWNGVVGSPVGIGVSAVDGVPLANGILPLGRGVLQSAGLPAVSTGQFMLEIPAPETARGHSFDFVALYYDIEAGRQVVSEPVSVVVP